MTLEQLMASYRVGEIDSNRVLETLQRQFGQDSATAQRTLQSFDRGIVPSATEVTDDGQDIPTTDPMGYTGSPLMGQHMLGREKPARPADKPTMPEMDSFANTGRSLMGPSMLGGDAGSAPGTNLLSNLWGGFTGGLGRGLEGWRQFGRELRGGQDPEFDMLRERVNTQGLQTLTPEERMVYWGGISEPVMAVDTFRAATNAILPRTNQQWADIVRGTGPIWGSQVYSGLGEDIGQAASDVGGFFKRLGGGTVPGTMANIAGAGAQQLVNFFGQDDNDLSSEQIKNRMQADVIDRDEAINLLNRNTGMSRTDAINTVTGWESETLTNIPFKQMVGDQLGRFREQVRSIPSQVAERVTGSPAGQAVGSAMGFAQRLPGILDRPLADTFGVGTTGTFVPGAGRSPEELLDMGASPAFYQSRETISPTGKVFPAGPSPMDLQEELESRQRYGKGFTPGVKPGTWFGEPMDPITGLRTDARGVVDRASGRQQTLQDFADDPAMGFDAFGMTSARPGLGSIRPDLGRLQTTPAASAAVDAVSRNMVSPTPIMDVDETVSGGFGGIAPSGVAPTPSVAPSVPAAPTGPAGRVMDLSTGPNVYQGTTITGTPPPFEMGDELWQRAQSMPELYERFRLSQFPGASLGDIQSEAGQRFLTQGYYPALGQFKLAEAMGMLPTGDTPQEQFAAFMGQQDRLSLDELRRGFGGLGDYLAAQAGAASAGTGTTGLVSTDFGLAFPDLKEGNLIAAAQAALGRGSGTYSGLKNMYDIFQTQYGPTGGKKAFVDWVGTGIPGYADRTPYVSSVTAPAAADIDYDPTRSTAATAPATPAATVPATPAAPIRKLTERESVSPQMKIGFDTSKPFVPSTPPEVKKLTKLKTFTPKQQKQIQDLRPTSSDVIELQAKANMIPGGGGYIGGGWSPEVTKDTYDALEDDLLMGGDGLGMGTPTKKKKKKFGSTLLKKFVGR